LRMNSYQLRNWPLSPILMLLIERSLKYSATNRLTQFVSWPRGHVFRKLKYNPLPFGEHPCVHNETSTLGFSRALSRPKAGSD
jgi:hypothetical protein